MALQIKELLGIDNISNGRIKTNENFALIVNQLNLLLNYIDSNFGTIVGLARLETGELRAALNKLVITASTSEINDNLTINGNLNLTGNLLLSNIYSTVVNNLHPDVVANSGEYPIGRSTSYPVYNTYQVSSSDSGGLTVNLFPGAQGQELLILMVGDSGGADTFIDIQNAPSSNGNLLLPNGTTSIQLNEAGELVMLKYVGSNWVVLNTTGIYV